VKRALQILAGLLIALGAMSAHAQRVFSQAELDAMLAPIALYPDPVLDQVLDAAQYPDDVQAAAAWSRANPQLNGDAALATASNSLWPPSVKALVAYPDILQRMAESPQWLADLGEAYASAQPYVMQTIQQLRARAQSSGYLRSDQNQSVYQDSGQIVVQPVYPSVVYVPYYDPYVVYGPWWWPAYRPVFWRPWHARPVIVTRIVQPVRIVERGHVWRQPGNAWRDGRRQSAPLQVTPYHAVPESQRMPIIQSTPAVRTPSFAPARVVQQHMQSAQSAPTAPTRSFTPARVVEQHARPMAAAPQPRAYVAPAPQVRQYPMPAPQARASERAFGRGFQASHGNASAGSSSGNRGGGRHRS
jgi:uncharacterized protein DUF3300